MLGSGDALTWLVTVWFGVLGAVAVVATVRSAGWIARVSSGAHVLMCLAMAAMPWPWAMRAPAVIPVLLFSAAVLWFAGLAVFRPDATHHAGVPVLAYHAAMMAAMVWMALLMSAPPDLPDGTGGPAATAESAGMAGMDMSGAAHTLAIQTTTLPDWAWLPSAGFVAVFVVAAIWYLARLGRPSDAAPPGPLPPVVDLLTGLGMAVGMGGSLLAMH
jgi:hypothetical protein